MGPMGTAYAELVAESRQIALLGSIGSVLGWDERTGMPPGAAPFRAEQSSLIAATLHERATSPRIGELLDRAADEVQSLDRHSTESANVRESRRHYDRQRKLPTSLVRELTETTVMSEQAWGQARRANDFKAFKPWLRKMLDLKRDEINCYGYETEPYDALLEDFEPGQTAANLRNVFASLKDPLVDLIRRIADSPRRPPAEILERLYPQPAQERLAKMAAAAVGFDFNNGALAVSTHPFCSGLGPGDTRMTTRYDERAFGDAFFGTLHETGHALYDQGLPTAQFGLPSGQAISLGIHESQSRMWENLVGRSRSFWRFFLPKAREAFPEALAGVSEDQWCSAINTIRPSFIRVESDQATYNLHILVRFELESDILAGKLGIDDIPEAWNAKYRQYLGITPKTYADGCLQDVHWSAGLIGYFPTYTLGNLYSAQFFERARADLGDLDAMFAKGDFAPLLGWLRENIHSVGQRYRASELVQRVTGKPLSAEPLLRHLRRLGSEYYGV